MENLIITGKCAHIGTFLTNQLIENGNNVTVIDTEWFGNYLRKSINLKIIKKDIIEISEDELAGHTDLIHLANIANDPAVELNPTLSWDVNLSSKFR